MPGPPVAWVFTVAAEPPSILIVAEPFVDATLVTNPTWFPEKVNVAFLPARLASFTNPPDAPACAMRVQPDEYASAPLLSSNRSTWNVLPATYDDVLLALSVARTRNR